MNALFCSLLYPKETMEEVAALSRDGVQNQINSYQHAFVEGIRENLRPAEALTIVNSLPVGIFPTKYRRLFLRGGAREGNMRELPAINLPWLKQRGREEGAYRAIRAWAQANPQNRTLLLYTLYLPYLKAVARAKKAIPALKAAAIVTDLPNEWGLASGRTGLAKKLEARQGTRQLALANALDGYVLLTPHMAERLPGGKPSIVIEGLIMEATPPDETGEPAASPVALYAGTLSPELGIGEMLDAFAALPECQLWLCGKGEMAREAERYAAQYPNIRFFGFVSQQEALHLQAQATFLLNPRSPKGAFTRYSFPSKTLEYMRSGKPVLCYRLEGIPADYDEYLLYIQGEGAEGIRASVARLLSRTPESLAKLGQAGRAYVLANKNPRVQCKRLMDFLRDLT